MKVRRVNPPNSYKCFIGRTPNKPVGRFAGGGLLGFSQEDVFDSPTFYPECRKIIVRNPKVNGGNTGGSEYELTALKGFYWYIYKNIFLVINLEGPEYWTGHADSYELNPRPNLTGDNNKFAILVGIKTGIESKDYYKVDGERIHNRILFDERVFMAQTKQMVKE